MKKRKYIRYKTGRKRGGQRYHVGRKRRIKKKARRLITGYAIKTKGGIQLDYQGDEIVVSKKDAHRLAKPIFNDYGLVKRRVPFLTPLKKR